MLFPAPHRDILRQRGQGDVEARLADIEGIAAGGANGSIIGGIAFSVRAPRRPIRWQELSRPI
jgi:hypothetical protein